MNNSFRRVTVDLPSNQVAFLEKIAKEEQISITDVLRRAIKTEQFFVENENANVKVLIDDGVNIRQIVRI